MIFKDFFYEYPEAAYLIPLVLLLIALYGYLYDRRRKFLEAFADDSVRKRVVAKRSLISFILKVAFICIAWILAALALMDPQGNARYPEEMLAELNKNKELPALRRRQHEVAFVVDTSRSMDVKDMRTGQSRLDFAKDVADETIRELKGDTISIYTFTASGSKLVPSTLDYIYARLLLKSLMTNDEGEGGTSLTGALQRVMRDFKELPNDTLKTIVLLSDGEDLHYSGLNAVEKSQFKDKLTDILGDAKAENLRLFAVGLGTKEGGVIPHILYQGKEVHSSMNGELLKALVAKGRGEYFQGDLYSSRAIAQAIIKAMAADNPYKPLYKGQQGRTSKPNRNDYIYDRYYRHFLIPAIVLLALALLIPDRWQRRKNEE